MLNQCAVRCYQLQPFDGTLRQQQTIKRVARRRDRIEGMHSVPVIDREMYHPECSEKIGKVVKTHSRIKFAKPRLDCDFPKACRTYKRSVFRCCYRTTDRLAKCVELAPRDTDQDVSINE